MSDQPARPKLTLKKRPAPETPASAPAKAKRPSGSRPAAPGGGKAWAGKPAATQARKPGGKPEGEAGRPARGPRPDRTAAPQKTDNPWGQAAARSQAAARVAPVVPSVPVSAGNPDDPWARWRQPAQAEAAAPESSVPVAQPEGAAPSGVRLSKVMAERGLCSRREADEWIERGWVLVNGQCISALGTRIDPAATIEVRPEAQREQAKQVTILLHKPVGYVSGQPEPGCTPAVALIGADNQVRIDNDPAFKPWMLRNLAPAGRLDVDSTGLLVLTQDGRVARQLIGEDSLVEKEYLVRVSGQMVANGLALLNHGLELDGRPLKPARVKQLNEDQLHFILREGRKRQIRRMCELVGLRVIGLKRVRIGRIRLGDLPLGQWRFLRPGEGF